MYYVYSACYITLSFEKVAPVRRLKWQLCLLNHSSIVAGEAPQSASNRLCHTSHDTLLLGPK